MDNTGLVNGLQPQTVGGVSLVSWTVTYWGSVFLKPVHPVSLGHEWVCSPGGSLVSGAKCSLLPPLPSGFHCKKARSQVLSPPELPEKGVRSPLTPPQGNTVYRLQKNATLVVQ
jgi:hypothetical protein